MLKSKKVLIASGSRHTIPPVHNSPGVPRIIFQLTEQNPVGFKFVVLSKYDQSLETTIYDKDKYFHTKPTLGTRLFDYFLKAMPYTWRKKKYGFSQPDRIVYYSELVSEAKKMQPDIIVTFMHVELFKMLQKALPNAKHIFFFRSTDLEGRVGKKNIDFILKNSAGFLANTKAPVEELKIINPKISFPMTTIYNAVPSMIYSAEEQVAIGAAFRKKFGLVTSDFVLGYAGRFSEEKSLMELFKVIKSLKDQGTIIHLIIAGAINNEKTPNMNYYNQLIAYNEQYLAGQIHMAGWITNAELFHFYCALDVGIVLSKYREGNSMFLIEAMSYGVPVIATAVGGNKEVITSNANGFLIELDTMEKDLEACLLVLRNDSLKYTSFSANARNYIGANHSIEKMTHDFSDYISKL